MATIDGKKTGGRPPGGGNHLTQQLNDWFDRSIIGAESEFQEHPVYRLLRIGYNQLNDPNDKGIIQDVPVAIQAKALADAMKYIRSPTTTKVEITGKDGTPLNGDLGMVEVQQRLRDLNEKVNQLTTMKVVSDQ